MYQPLADLLRPTSLDEVFGQDHILAPGAVLRRLIDSGSEERTAYEISALSAQRILPEADSE